MTEARYLLDTDTCIYIRRDRPSEVRRRFMMLGRGEAVISVVTYGELLLGAEKSRIRGTALQILDNLFALLPIEPLGPEAGVAYSAVRASLERRGEMIGSNDLWIAAHALAAGLTLVTNNEREFRRVEGLPVENWAARQPS